LRELSWKPINFHRWIALTYVLSLHDPVSAAKLRSAVLGFKLAWGRQAEDLDRLFVPSGPPGTHAAHHFHLPVDPSDRDEALAAAIVDYESALIYLDIALAETVRTLHSAGVLPDVETWTRLVRAAESSSDGLAGSARDTILYLQRTPLYVRNKALVHPKTLLPVVRTDNVGNLLFYRIAITNQTPEQLEELNDLLHEVRMDIDVNFRVGVEIDAQMALNWIGALSDQVDDWQKLNSLRESFGFLLPGAYEIAPKVDRLIDACIEQVPRSEVSEIALAAGPMDSRGPRPSRVVEGANDQVDQKQLDFLEREGMRVGNDGDHHGAAKIFAELVRLNPEDGLAHLNLGRALISIDELEAGLRHLYVSRAISATADEVRGLLIKGHFNLGVRHYKAGRFVEAVPHYRRVVELDPHDAEARRNLVSSLARSDQPDEAFVQAAQLVQLHGNDPETYFCVALVFSSVSKHREVVAHARRALSLRPDWPEAHALLEEALSSGA
jgi:Flp pilus assembly protein TadD